MMYLLFEAREEVTTVPALAQGGEPSTPARLLRGEKAEDTSESALPLFPKTRKVSLSKTNNYWLPLIQPRN